MSYTVLARRYRSGSFEEVVGQEAIARTLRNALATDRVAHAYLFTGTRGVGKTTMARILAKALNCLSSEGPTPEPCGQCDSCERIAGGEDIDVLEIDGASNTGVDHIRDLRQNAIYRPARSRFKVYIIDEVHMLSTSAFNALLKTLEEPPEHVKFILATTEPNKVPATIQSRCQRFDFRNLSVEEIAGQLETVLAGEGVKAQEGVTRRVARLARGSMRDALSLLDQLLSMATGEVTAELLRELTGEPETARVEALAGALAAGEAGGVLRAANEAFDAGLGPEVVAEALQEYLRDLMVLRTCGWDTEMVEAQGEAREAMRGQAQQFDEATLVYQISVLEEVRRALKGGGSGRALLEAALVRLSRAERFSDTRALLEKLDAIEGSLEAGGSEVRTAGKMPAARGKRGQDVVVPEMSGTRDESRAGGLGHGENRGQDARDTKLSLPGKVDLAWLQESWEVVLDALAEHGGKHVESYLRAARPVGFDGGGVLALGFAADEGMGRFLAGQPAVIEEVEKRLGKLLLREIKVSVTEMGAKAGNRRTGEQENGRCATGQRMRSPGAKPSQKEINEALSDENVRKVQDVLGGKVKGVERGQ